MNVDLYDFLKNLLERGIDPAGVRIRFLDDDVVSTEDDTVIRIFEVKLVDRSMSIRYRYEDRDGQLTQDYDSSWSLLRGTHRVNENRITPLSTLNPARMEILVTDHRDQ